MDSSSFITAAMSPADGGVVLRGVADLVLLWRLFFLLGFDFGPKKLPAVSSSESLRLILSFPDGLWLVIDSLALTGFSPVPRLTYRERPRRSSNSINTSPDGEKSNVDKLRWSMTLGANAMSLCLNSPSLVTVHRISVCCHFKAVGDVSKLEISLNGRPGRAMSHICTVDFWVFKEFKSS